MPGPAPKADGERRRRNPAPQTRKLPAEGRAGDPPKWPLSGMFDEELAVWSELWRTPQAMAWEELGWDRTVARYCRVLVEAERANAMAATRAEARQLEDRLGLTPMSMLRLRWQIVEDELAERREEQAAPARRKHIRAVDPSLTVQPKPAAKPKKKAARRAVARAE